MICSHGHLSFGAFLSLVSASANLLASSSIQAGQAACSYFAGVLAILVHLLVDDWVQLVQEPSLYSPIDPASSIVALSLPLPNRLGAPSLQALVLGSIYLGMGHLMTC